jgi:hypothetical protein
MKLPALCERFPATRGKPPTQRVSSVAEISSSRKSVALNAAFSQ